MDEHLQNVRLKMARADAHIEEVKAALNIGPRAVAGQRTHGIGIQDDWTLEYTTDIPVPGPECGIILGEAIHQLRSALDHLLCALAMRNHDRSICEELRLQFPIHKDAAGFLSNRLVSQGTLESALGTREFRFVEDSQPYQRNQLSPTFDPLYILGQLDNIDKHRIVLVLDQRLAISGYFESAKGMAPFAVSHQPVKPGAQALDVGRPLPEPPYAVRVENMAPFIVFSETDGLCDGAGIFPMFRAMQGTVATIIDGSVRFFENG